MLQKILKDSFWYGAGNAVSKAFIILLVPIYTRLLSKSEFGILEILTTTSSIIIIILSLGVGSGTARYFYEAEKLNKDKILVSTSFWFLIRFTLLILLPILFYYKNITDIFFKNSIKSDFILLTFCSVPFIVIYNFILIILRLKKKVFLFLALNLCYTFLTFFIIIFLIKKSLWGINGILVGQLISAAISWYRVTVYKRIYKVQIFV